MDVFWQNMAMKAVIFSWKIGEKRASYWLIWPIQTSRKNAWYYSCVLKKKHFQGGGGVRNYSCVLRKQTFGGVLSLRGTCWNQNYTWLSAKKVKIMFDIIGALWEEKISTLGIFFIWTYDAAAKTQYADFHGTLAFSLESYLLLFFCFSAR